GGLNKFDRKKRTFKHYRESDGLPNEVIYGILEDGKGNLWLSTNKGLAAFNPQTEQFKSYDVRDGIQNNEFNQGAYYKARNGEMLFGGINGFNLFHPDSLKENKNIPNIVITDFQIFYKSVSVASDNFKYPVLTKSVSETKEINLTYADNVISFEFSALDYQTPSKNKYAYRMEGFDNNWNYTDANRRFVTYTNLDPGEYTFRVKGSNSDGVWNEEGVSVNIYISPPWWATWWAYGFYGLFFLSGLFAIRAYDMKRQRLKHELKLEHEHSLKLQEIDQMKSRFFANISHEFRTPLTLILGPIEKIMSGIPFSEIQKNADLVKKNAQRLLGLIGQLLDLSRLDEGKLKLKVSRNNLVSFVKGIVMTFDTMAEKKDIKLKVNSDQEFMEVYFDKEKMEKAVINILSNAFKFTNDGGTITVIMFERNDTTAVVKIRDTGIGISPTELPKLFDRFYQVDSSHTRDKGGTGIGLALTKELVELHHGRITVGSVEGQWTEFTIELRLGKEHFDINEFADDINEYSTQLPEIENLNYDLNNAAENPNTSISESEDDRTLILVVEDNPDVRNFIKDSLVDDYQVD
ncbi:MAG TPA: ATP-binding protein, partial [Ignavibacteriaceae bacterium]